MLQETSLKSSANNHRLVLVLGIKKKNRTKRLTEFIFNTQSPCFLHRRELRWFPGSRPLGSPAFPLSPFCRAGSVPWAMRSFTSRSTGVETTDLVRTNTFSRPITTTKYGNISLEETEAEQRMRSSVKNKGGTQVEQQTCGKHYPVLLAQPLRVQHRFVMGK